MLALLMVLGYFTTHGALVTFRQWRAAYPDIAKVRVRACYYACVCVGCVRVACDRTHAHSLAHTDARRLKAVPTSSRQQRSDSRCWACHWDTDAHTTCSYESSVLVSCVRDR
jgi:hypothetical protein